MDWVLVLKVLGPVVVAIAIFMETYKKKIKKNKFDPIKVWKIAGLLSLLFSAVGYFSFDLPGHYVSILYYTICVYALQFIVDMKVLKFLLKVYAKSKGIVLEGYEWDE
jgi:ABC-type multidrug transport system permease subunit